MKFSKEINIDGRLISKGSPTFVIAEAGVNHGGDMEIAKQFIDLAEDANANADEVKFHPEKSGKIGLNILKFFMLL